MMEIYIQYSKFVYIRHIIDATFANILKYFLLHYTWILLGTEIIDIEVTDVDTVGTLSFEIISGNAENLFMIDSSGRITLAASGLDFESSSSFNLVVRVFDGVASVSTCISQTTLFNIFNKWILYLVGY